MRSRALSLAQIIYVGIIETNTRFLTIETWGIKLYSMSFC